jgi:hypothetical protein
VVHTREAVETLEGRRATMRIISAGWSVVSGIGPHMPPGRHRGAGGPPSGPTRAAPPRVSPERLPPEAGEDLSPRPPIPPMACGVASGRSAQTTSGGRHGHRVSDAAPGAAVSA